MKKPLVVLVAGIFGATSLSALAITQDEAVQRETQMQILSGYHADTPAVTVHHSQTTATSTNTGTNVVSSAMASLKSKLSADREQVIQREERLEIQSGYDPDANIVPVDRQVTSMGTFAGISGANGPSPKMPRSSVKRR